jgi:hypothetical protein
MADAFSGVTAVRLAQLRDASLDCLHIFEGWLQRVCMLAAHVEAGDMPPDTWLDRVQDGAKNLRDAVDRWKATFDQNIKNWLVRANIDSIDIPPAFDDRFATVSEIAFVAASRALEIFMPFDLYPCSPQLILAARNEAKQLRHVIEALHLEPLIRGEWARAEKLLDDCKGPDVRESAKDAHAADLLERFPENDIRTLIVLLETLSQPWWWRVNQEQWEEFERYRDMGDEEAGCAYRYDREGESAKAAVHRRYSQDFYRTSENYHAIRIHAFHNTVTRAETILRRELKKLLGDFPSIDLEVERTTPPAEMAQKFKRLLGLVLAEPCGSPEPIRPDPKPREQFAHGPGFRSVHWFGTEHSFTTGQAACVRILWEAWENRTPEVSEQAILEVSGSSGDRLRDLFKEKGKGFHGAWKTMIVSGTTKGTFRLVEPENSIPQQNPHASPK